MHERQKNAKQETNLREGHSQHVLRDNPKDERTEQQHEQAEPDPERVRIEQSRTSRTP